MRMLLVEDNQEIRKILRLKFEAECFAVDEAPDGESGSFMARTNRYDIIILDNVLPKKMGGHICNEIRKELIDTPILMLSGQSDIFNKVTCLDGGADDYVTKPFSFEELKSRINALLRRPKNLLSEKIEINNISLDKNTHIVRVDGHRVYMTRKEFALLEYLLTNRGRILSRGEIMEHVWDINANPFSNTIESHIVSIRKKIGDKTKEIIVNMPGRGYIFKG